MIRPPSPPFPSFPPVRWGAAALSLLLLALPALAQAGQPDAAKNSAPPGDGESRERAKKRPKAEAKKAKAKAKGSKGRKKRVGKRSDKGEAGGAERSASFRAEAKKKKADRPGKGRRAKESRRSKQVAARTEAGRRRLGGSKKAEAPRKPCASEVVSIDRGGLETDSYPLVDCEGKVLEEARVRLSVLARPWGAPKPGAKPSTREAEAAPGVKLLDPGLVLRLHAIARKFRGKAVSLVSGYRPESGGSLHQDGRALDLRVVGVDNAELVAFCKTLKDTGCGFYPNSSFVHVDARPEGKGSVSWIDASGPGEAPRYVTQWPPPAEPAFDASAPEASEAAKATNENPGEASSPAPKSPPASPDADAPTLGELEDPDDAESAESAGTDGDAKAESAEPGNAEARAPAAAKKSDPAPESGKKPTPKAEASPKAPAEGAVEKSRKSSGKRNGKKRRKYSANEGGEKPSARAKR